MSVNELGYWFLLQLDVDDRRVPSKQQEPLEFWMRNLAYINLGTKGKCMYLEHLYVMLMVGRKRILLVEVGLERDMKLVNMLWKQLWVNLPLKRTLCSFLPCLVLVVSWQVRFLTKIYHPNIDKVWSLPFPCSFFLCSSYANLLCL